MIYILLALSIVSIIIYYQLSKLRKLSLACDYILSYTITMLLTKDNDILSENKKRELIRNMNIEKQDVKDTADFLLDQFNNMLVKNDIQDNITNIEFQLILGCEK